MFSFPFSFCFFYILSRPGVLVRWNGWNMRVCFSSSPFSIFPFSKQTLFAKCSCSDFSSFSNVLSSHVGKAGVFFSLYSYPWPLFYQPTLSVWFLKNLYYPIHSPSHPPPQPLTTSQPGSHVRVRVGGWVGELFPSIPLHVCHYHNAYDLFIHLFIFPALLAGRPFWKPNLWYFVFFTYYRKTKKWTKKKKEFRTR